MLASRWLLQVNPHSSISSHTFFLICLHCHLCHYWIWENNLMSQRASYADMNKYVFKMCTHPQHLDSVHFSPHRGISRGWDRRLLWWYGLQLWVRIPSGHVCLGTSFTSLRESKTLKQEVGHIHTHGGLSLFIL